MTTSAETFVRTFRSTACTRRALLSVRARHVGDVAVVDVDGEVDLITSTTVCSATDDALESAPSGLVLDLTGVTFCGCAGLTVLLDTADKARNAGIPLRLVCAGRVILRPLHLTGLVDQFQIQPNLDAALQNVTGSGFV
jgi:anti-sigma B factor antagonist